MMLHLHDDHLLDQAQCGNALAIERLLSRYWDRLCQMSSFLLDPWLSARVDPEDIVQDALLRATLRLPVYLKNRPVAFLPWLKSLVNDELTRVHRQHVHAQTRSVHREQLSDRHRSTDSVERLVDELVGRDLSPSQHAITEEQSVRIMQVLNRLNGSEREILIMRYARQLSIRAIAEEMEISRGSAKSRLWRAQKGAARLLRRSVA